MRTWLVLLGGMLVWTLHFFGLYAVGSIFETSGTARLLAGILTLLCLALDALVLAVCLRSLRRPGGGTAARWAPSVGAFACILSITAVMWQGLPALLA